MVPRNSSVLDHTYAQEKLRTTVCYEAITSGMGYWSERKVNCVPHLPDVFLSLFSFAGVRVDASEHLWPVQYWALIVTRKIAKRR